MDLPGDQDALIEAVLDANPDTVVVVNAASPVTMPWADRARAILISWFGGQEMAGALADVLLGDSDPGGRLPTTQPLRVEHNPSYGNFPGENGEVRYGEGVLMGYRWYDARALPVRFPFGHGLSYATLRDRRPARLRGDVRARRDAHRRGRRRQHVRPRRLRGRPALRRAAAERARPPAAGAARLREGPPRPRRDHHGGARAHRPRVRLLGPGRPELGVPAPARRRLPHDPLRRGPPHHGRLADRPGRPTCCASAAPRPTSPRGPAARRLVARRSGPRRGGASARGRPRSPPRRRAASSRGSRWARGAARRRRREPDHGALAELAHLGRVDEPVAAGPGRVDHDPVEDVGLLVGQHVLERADASPSEETSTPSSCRGTTSAARVRHGHRRYPGPAVHSLDRGDERSRVQVRRDHRLLARGRDRGDRPRHREGLETLRNIDWFEVVSVRGHVADGKVAHYQATLKIGFRLED